MSDERKRYASPAVAQVVPFYSRIDFNGAPLDPLDAQLVAEGLRLAWQFARPRPRRRIERLLKVLER